MKTYNRDERHFNGYRRLILVGNGFDLALGLKTNYSDFVLDYLKRCAKECIGSGKCINHLVHWELTDVNVLIGFLEELDECENVADFMSAAAEKINTNVNKSNLPNLFTSIIWSYSGSNWVGIEALYYDILQYYLKDLQRTPYDRKNYLSVVKLNDQLDELTSELKMYLKRITNGLRFNKMDSPFYYLMQGLYAPLKSSDYEKVWKDEEVTLPDDIMFLNFNYTKTLFQIMDHEKATQVHIHGSIYELNNPIVFGYGDDTSKFSRVRIRG